MLLIVSEWETQWELLYTYVRGCPCAFWGLSSGIRFLFVSKGFKVCSSEGRNRTLQGTGHVA